MYLLSNKKIENGSTVERKDHRGLFFEKLNSNNLYYNKIVKSYSASYSVSSTGDVDCSLLDDFDEEPTLYEYIYEVEEDGFYNLKINKRLSDYEYMKLVVSLILDKKKRVDIPYRVAEVLENNVIRGDELISVLELIKTKLGNLSGNEYGFLTLFKRIESLLLDEYACKNEYMKSLCEYLSNNIDLIGIVTGEEMEYLRNTFEKYKVENEYIKNLNNLKCEELPF